MNRNPTLASSLLLLLQLLVLLQLQHTCQYQLMRAVRTRLRLRMAVPTFSTALSKPAIAYDWREGRNWASVESFYQSLMGLPVEKLPPFLRGGGRDGDKEGEECGVYTLTDIQALNQAGHVGGEFLSLNERYSGHSARKNYALSMGYVGSAYFGFQSTPQKNAVEDELRVCLKTLGFGAQGLTVAGRTDKGVTAFSQVVSFASSLQNLSAQVMLEQLRETEPVLAGKMAFFDLARVPKSYNARSSAKWRRYIYILPLRKDGQDHIDVDHMNAILEPLVNKSLPYNALAFGEQYNVGQGLKDHCTLLKAKCFYMDLHSASATRSPSPLDISGMSEPVMVVELVGDRFLRRMVRILLATAAHASMAKEQVQDKDFNVLIDIALSNERSRAQYALPGAGLCFAGVGYNCFQLATFQFQSKAWAAAAAAAFSSAPLSPAPEPPPEP